MGSFDGNFRNGGLVILARGHPNVGSLNLSRNLSRKNRPKIAQDWIAKAGRFSDRVLRSNASDVSV